MFSFFFMTKAALRHMKKGASILNTTSITAFRGHKTLLDYSATKGAIVSMTRSLSRGADREGHPRQRRGAGADLDAADSGLVRRREDARHGASAPMERAGQPNEVAPCFVFLASEDASYISGQVLHPNGGNVVG